MRNIIIGATVVAMMASCSGSNPEHEAAVALRGEIDSLMNAKNFDEALARIDTLNKKYPLEIDLRKDMVGLQAKAREGKALLDIPRLDGEIARLQQETEALKSQFTLVQPSKALPGYLVATGEAKTDLASKAGLQARVNTGQDAADTPWTIAANAGRNIGLTGITVTTGNGASFTLRVPAGAEDMASVSPESADELGRYLNDNPDDKATSVTFSGSKGKAEVKLTPAQSSAIAMAWKLASLQTELRSSLIDREKQERILQIARDQASNAREASEPSAN